MEIQVSNNQLFAVKSFSKIKGFAKLKQELIVANKTLIEKDLIIEGLRLDLAHLVNQIPKLKTNKQISI